MMTKFKYFNLCILAYIFIISLFTTLYSYYTLPNSLTQYLLAFGIGGNFIIAVLLCQKIISEEKIAKAFDKQVDAINNFSGIIRMMRSERHDYLNHLQTIGGLLSLKKADKAEEYMKDLVSDIKINNNLLVIKNYMVIALLQSKYNQAAEKSIKVIFDIRSDLKGLAVKDTDMTVILGNLINNAFDAVAQINLDQRYIMISIFENDDKYSICITNSGSSISQEDIEKIFNEEYSTKGTGRGYGLSLVQAALKRNCGSIKVSANPTTFTAQLPKVIGND